ncbi:MAG TPA: tetratricopeptide repeat protein [Actinomycetes bacterium]|nr:tetratricopeptide repeat protein [Actinomycetes bacterium]
MRTDLPTGTVTFLFTDIEGSTRLLHELGSEAYAAALLEHRRLVRAACAAYDGVEVDTQGDAFFVAFPTAPGAVLAAARIVEDLRPGPIRLRMGLHTGTPYVTAEGYVGEDVHRAARIAACGHGGQVLVSSATAALLRPGTLPDGLDLRDLGDHRLKDLSAAERIHQLGDDDFAPLKSLHRTNLPVPATPFLGRTRELAEVTDLLSRVDVRLLTLTGPGGTGKSRLALQAAAEVSDRFPGGVFWVPLAPLRDPGLVLATAAAAVGTGEDLRDHIGDKSMLLLLDNFEHLMGATADLHSLMATCPKVVLLVTSRETLRLPGEQAYPVPPLRGDEAVELFAARARAADPHFVPGPTLVLLTERLDRLPLAIELAAARVRVLTMDQLVDRLDRRLDLLKAGRGADPRQQTLRATIEWSHDLLDDEERRLFARLGVFSGGCTLESAERVCDADLDVLESLVDKSLVRVRDGDRFWMLETIREYAVERLRDSAELAELRRRHAEHFLALGEEAAPHLRGSAAARWLDRLDDEHDNVRAALEWFAREQRVDEHLRLAASLVEFWLSRGFLSEGRRILADALAAGDGEPGSRARALDGAAVLAVSAGDTGAARSPAAEALAIHQRLGDEAARAESLWTLGYVAVEDKDWSAAQKAVEESTSIFRRVGDVPSLLGASRTLAWIHHMRGDLDTARRLHEQNLALARGAGHQAVQAAILGSLGNIATEQGRLADAATMLRENQRLVEALGDRTAIVVNLARIARLLALLGERETAAALLACSEEASRTMGGWEAWAGVLNDGTRAMLEGLPQDLWERAARRGVRLAPEDAAREALSVAAQALEPEHRAHGSSGEQC